MAISALGWIVIGVGVLAVIAVVVAIAAYPRDNSF
jgi:hypothetical protein